MTLHAPSGRAPAGRFPVERWTLANGLRVVVQPDPARPLVAVNMCYGAGSRWDPPSRPGLAHFCEHLAFDGPRDAPGGTFPARIESAGGSSHAITTTDRLSFFALVPRRELPAVLAVEAERMARPFEAHDGEALESHRRVLLQELRERSRTRPRAAAFEEIERRLFPEGHPCARPPAGDSDGIRAITADDVETFVRRRFSPRNAVLVLVGGVSGAAAAELVRRAFDGLPSGVEAVPQAPVAGRPPGGGASGRVRAAVSRTHAHVAWAIPGFGQPEWYLASLVVRSLAVGRSSPLAAVLVERTGLAEEVHGHLLGMRDASTLVFGAVAARGVETGRLEAGLAGTVEGLLAAGLSAAGLERARKKALTDHYFHVQHLERRADLCASLTWCLDAPDRLDDEARRYAAPGQDAVAAFASGLACAPSRATLSLVPWADAA